jgi:Mor family transcriptional regulator
LAELDILEIIHEEVFSSARRLGVGNQIAIDIALSAEDALRARCGNDRYFIRSPDRSARDGIIFVEYSSGATLENISERYDLSVRQVRRILGDYGVKWGDGPPIDYAVRDLKIMAVYLQGASVAALAETFGLSRRRVQCVIQNNSVAQETE